MGCAGAALRSLLRAQEKDKATSTAFFESIIGNQDAQKRVAADNHSELQAQMEQMLAMLAKVCGSLSCTRIRRHVGTTAWGTTACAQHCLPPRHANPLSPLSPLSRLSRLSRLSHLSPPSRNPCA